MDATRYLERIGFDSQTGPPSLDLLSALQLAHLTSVPFENLHVFHRRGVRTDVGWSYPKVVEQRRGGWCFELNGSFGTLLREIGFRVDMVACRVWMGDDFGPDFDHLALVVHLDGSRWLVDVGFGDNCVHPLLLESGERDAVPRRARLDVTADGFTLTELETTEVGVDQWAPQATGTFVPRLLSEFDHRCHALQTDGLFTEKPFATRALDGTGNRVTLRREVLRRRHADGTTVDEPVEPERWSETLAAHFELDDSLM